MKCDPVYMYTVLLFYMTVVCKEGSGKLAECTCCFPVFDGAGGT